MYDLVLLAHNGNRWLVLRAMVWVLYLNWSGWLGKGKWHPDTESRATCSRTPYSIRPRNAAVLEPSGLAQAALRDWSTMLKHR